MKFRTQMLIQWKMDFSLPCERQCTDFRRNCFIRLTLITGTTCSRQLEQKYKRMSQIGNCIPMPIHSEIGYFDAV
jgi:hypothetical protein